MNFGGTYSVLNKATKVEEWPFPHLVIEDCLPDWVYKYLKKYRPKLDPGDIGQNKRYDWRAQHALSQNIHPIWEEFIEYHCSSEFYKQVDALFDLGLKGEVGMRYRDKTPIRLDCQISINTPVTEESQVCIAHIDNPETKWAGLLYMPDDDDDAGGDLEIYDCQKPEYFGKRRVANPGDPVKIVPYKDNVFVCFKNTPTSVHAPQPRKPTKINRKMVNFVIDS